MALNYLWYFASFLKLRKRIADCICSYITSFIPIDVLCDTFVSANIWLIMLHDHLHCLVFKEHLAVALASQLLYITSRRLLCQEFFSNSFFEATAFRGCLRRCALAVCRRLALYYTLCSRVSTPFCKKIGGAEKFLCRQTGTEMR